MPQQGDKLKALYGNLVKEGYDLPDENTFRADMADPNKRQKFHGNLVKEGYDLPDFNTFSTDMGFVEKKAAPLQQAIPPTGSGASSLVGGTSASVTGVSASPKFNWTFEQAAKDLESQTTQQLKEGALGTAPVVALPKSKPELTVTTFSGAAQIPVNDQVAAQTRTLSGNRQERTKKLIDDYDQFVQQKNDQAQKLGQEPPMKKNAAEWYTNYLKKNDPSEYSYISSKYLSLKNDLEEQRKIDPNDKEGILATKEKALQKFQADLYGKAVSLKNEVLNGKLEYLNNNINKNYSAQVSQLNDIDKQAEKLIPQIEELGKKIESFQRDGQGNIIADKFGGKDVQNTVNQYNELIGQYTGLKGQRDQLLQGDLKELNDQVTDIQRQWKDNYNDALTYIKRFPDYKKDLEEAKKQQEITDLQYQLKDSPGKFLSSVGSSIGRAFTDAFEGLSYLPKSMGEGSEYGWTDKFYDKVGDGINRFNTENLSLPSDYNKPTWDSRNRTWNLEYLPAKVARGVTDMGLMMAGGEAVGASLSKLGMATKLADNIGTVASGFVMEANNSYKSAKAAGLNEETAEEYGNINGLLVAALELVSPNKDLISPKFIKEGAESVAKKIATGVSTKEAIGQYAKEVLTNVGKETSQEVLQTLQEKVDQYMANELVGANFDVSNGMKDEITETIIVTALTTLLTGGISPGDTKTRLQKDALLSAAQNPQGVMSAIDKMVENKKMDEAMANRVKLQVKYANDALQRMPEDLPEEKKAEALPMMVDKVIIEEAKKKADSSFKNKFDEQLKQAEANIQTALNLPKTETTNGKEEEKGQVLNTNQQEETQTVSTAETQNTTPEVKREDITIKMEPQFQGGMERQFNFVDGKWKLKIGNEYTDVSPSLQKQVEQKFVEENNIAPETTAVTDQNLQANNTEQNALQKPTTGGMGLRNEATIREGMGSQNQPEITTQEGEQTQQTQIQEEVNKNIPPVPPSTETGFAPSSEEEMKKRAQTIRMEDNKHIYEKALSGMTEQEKNYNPINIDEQNNFVTKIIDEASKHEGAIEKLSHSMINNEGTPFPPSLNHVAAFHLAEKMWEMAEKTDDEAIKSSLENQAERLYGMSAMVTTNAAQQLAMVKAIAKHLPSSTVAMRRRVNAEIKATQDRAMTEEQKKTAKDMAEEINKAVIEELKKINEYKFTKEELKEIEDDFDSLLIDTSEC